MDPHNDFLLRFSQHLWPLFTLFGILSTIPFKVFVNIYALYSPMFDTCAEFFSFFWLIFMLAFTHFWYLRRILFIFLQVFILFIHPFSYSRAQLLLIFLQVFMLINHPFSNPQQNSFQFFYQYLCHYSFIFESSAEFLLIFLSIFMSLFIHFRFLCRIPFKFFINIYDSYSSIFDSSPEFLLIFSPIFILGIHPL